MGFPNTSHNSNFKVVMSNFPGVEDHSVMKYFDNYLRSVDLPSFSLETVESFYGKESYSVNHVISHKNDSLSELSITFKASEDLLNYLYAFKYIQSMRHGINSSDISDKLVADKIHSIEVQMLDNQKRIIARINFKDCLITDLGGLSLSYAEDIESDFTLTAKYENIIVETEDIYV